MNRESRSVQASVIMAEYNTDPEKLNAAVDSILKQTFRNFELIIVDDCGSNDIRCVVKNVNDSRIRLLTNSKNMGLPFSLNRAISEAKSEILVRMDTDDIAHPDRLKKQISFLQTNPEYAVVGSRAYLLSDGIRTGVLGVPGEKTSKQLMRGDSLIHPSVAMLKKAVVNVGKYPSYRRAEDLGLWCELLLADYKFYVMKDILLDYRVDKRDYDKRSLRHRGGELKARLHYYPKLGAGPIEYVRIVKSVLAGLAPASLISRYHQTSSPSASYRG